MDKLHDINLDRITFQLKEKHNVEWLEAMGTVFTARSINKIREIYPLELRTMGLESL